jgi:hypothetical protein
MRQARWLAAVVAICAPALAEDSDEEIARKLNDPVSSLISVPFQFNWDFNSGPLDEGTQFKLNFQPVVPLTLNKDWKLIVRTIVPYVSQEDVFTGPRPSFPGLPNEVLSGLDAQARADLNRAAERAFDREVRNRPVDRHQTGLGDITQSFFFSPEKGGPFGTKLGIGPAFLYPSATDDLLGTEKWCVGPTLVVLKQQSGWTYGVLANHLWSFAGDEERADVNATFVQPFLSYQTKSHTTFGINAEATYDWNASQWTAPVNFTVSQLVRIGKAPVSFGLGARYFAEGPSGTPEWGCRFTITLVLPGSGSTPPSTTHQK